MPTPAKEWIEKNRERYNEYHRRYRSRNIDTIREGLEDPDEIWFVRDYRKRKAVKQATPSWANRDQIRRFYQEAVIQTKLRGIEFEVDHIIPISNKKVCGLHIPSNLRVVSKSLNKRKGNKFSEEKLSHDAMEILKSLGL